MYTLSRFNNHNLFDPFREMEQMQRDLWGKDDTMFRIDIADKGDVFELNADLPGVNKDDIHLDLEGDILTISAERNNETEEKDEHGWIRRERSFGSFTRTLDVSAVDVDSITAKYEDGVLKLTMPKKENILPAARRLAID